MTVVFQLDESTFLEGDSRGNNYSDKPRYAREGFHDFEVVDMGAVQPNKYDSTWVSVALELRTAAGYIHTTYVNLPTTKFTFRLKDGSESMGIMRARVIPFLQALGIPDTDTANPNAVNKLLVSLFHEGKIVGKKFSGTLGYGKGSVHVKRMDDGQYKICDHEGKALVDGSFADRDAAVLEAKQLLARKEIKGVFKRFPELVTFSKTDGVNNFPQTRTAALGKAFGTRRG